MNKIKYLNGKDGKPVCTLCTDEYGRVHTQRVIDPEKHINRIYDAISYDAYVLRQAKEQGVEYHTVSCPDWDSDKFALSKDFDTHRRTIVIDPAPVQECLPLRYWHKGSMPPAPKKDAPMIDKVRHWWVEHAVYAARLSAYLPIFPVLPNGLPAGNMTDHPITPFECGNYFCGSVPESRLAVKIGYRGIYALKIDYRLYDEFAKSYIDFLNCGVLRDGNSVYVIAVADPGISGWETSSNYYKFSIEVIREGYLILPNHDDEIVRCWIREPSHRMEHTNLQSDLIDVLMSDLYESRGCL